jgi:hypothetical protein
MKHAFQIPEHIVIPEAQHTITVGFDLSRSRQIGCALLIMLPSIEFNNEFRSPADKVHNERPDKSLPSEMRASKRDVVAKPLP